MATRSRGALPAVLFAVVGVLAWSLGIASGQVSVSSTRAGNRELAERYATALFELAEEKAALDAVAGDLGAIRRMLGESVDLRRLIGSPAFTRDQQARAMAAVLERAGAVEITRRFVGVVCRNRRLSALPEVIDAFLALLAARRGEVRAEVASAAPLGEAEAARLAEGIRRVVGGTVTLDVRVDPALLGGLVVRVGSRLYDSSLRSKLERMKLAMKGVG
ncbi:MAG: F0F1 ATP synthase subunit delta [Proteobacteria bacterium]|nr:F0F1 ATP synthase subunit delta [Pseudomonadota bacterium]